MADDDKKSPEEYEYPPEEYYQGGETPEKEPLEPLEPEEEEPRPGRSGRFWLILGLIGAVAGVYLLLNMFTVPRQEVPERPAAPLPVAVAPAPKPAPAVAEVPSAVVPEESTTTKAIQTLAQQNQANQQAIAGLQNQMQQLQSQITEVTNTITNLNTQLQVIVNEIRANALDRAIRGRTPGMMTVGTAYTLKALVPGRAWLQAKDGSTTSVTIGDRLRGYGIIQTINTEQGLVTTSSGALIEYGPRDS